MKVQVFDPKTGARIGATSLRKHIAPGYLKLAGFTPGTHLGQPVMRTRTYGMGADDTRAAWLKLRYWVELTGWSVKVSTTVAEARALQAGGLVSGGTETYRMIHNGQRVEVLAGHGKVTQ